MHRIIYNTYEGVTQKITINFDSNGLIGEQLTETTTIVLPKIQELDLGVDDNDHVGVDVSDLLFKGILPVQKKEGLIYPNFEGAVRRFEFVNGIYKELVSLGKISSADIENQICEDNYLSLDCDYYYTATKFAFLSNRNFYGLYLTKDDYAGYITWCEAAYLLFYVFAPYLVKADSDWRISNTKNLFICTLTVKHGEKSFLETRLDAYKNKIVMDEYLELMREGARYTPLPLYGSFMNLVHRGIVAEEDIFRQVKRSEVIKALSVFGGNTKEPV